MRKTEAMEVNHSQRWWSKSLSTSLGLYFSICTMWGLEIISKISSSNDVLQGTVQVSSHEDTAFNSVTRTATHSHKHTLTDVQVCHRLPPEDTRIPTPSWTRKCPQTGAHTHTHAHALWPGLHTHAFIAHNWDTGPDAHSQTQRNTGIDTALQSEACSLMGGTWDNFQAYVDKPSCLKCNGNVFISIY